MPSRILQGRSSDIFIYLACFVRSILQTALISHDRRAAVVVSLLLSGSGTDCWGCEHSCCRLASVAAVLRLSTDFSDGVWATGAPQFADLDTRNHVRVVTWALVAVDVLINVSADFTLLADRSLFSSAPGFVVFKNNAFVW